jgi:hypothetical protein
VITPKDFRYRDVLYIAPKNVGTVQESGGENDTYYIKRIQAPVATEYEVTTRAKSSDIKPHMLLGLE